MTLNIGNNIRDLRKSVDMTQEQLALRLGVSYQSVSRWENGGTYPDLELIPAIADIFSASVDTLLGISQKQKEEKANEAFDALRREAMKNDPDVQAVNEIIRDIRRNYMDTSLMWRFWNEGNDRLYRHPEILSEVRLTAEAYLEMEISSGFDKNQAIETMVRIEDDNNIEDFLKKYASVTDITESALKLKRYSFRGEWEKYDEERQNGLFMLIDSLCDSRSYISGPAYPFSPPCDSIELYEFQLNTLNCFCGYDRSEVYPVSGNGKLDFGVEIRLTLGFKYACLLASSGRTEEAFTALEDCVSLIEQIMEITEPTVLKCDSKWMKNFTFTAQPNYFNLHNDPDGANEYNIWIHAKDGSTYMIYPSVYYNMLTSQNGWDGFDVIRESKDYKQLALRLKNLIKYEK